MGCPWAPCTAAPYEFRQCPLRQGGGVQVGQLFCPDHGVQYGGRQDHITLIKAQHGMLPNDEPWESLIQSPFRRSSSRALTSGHSSSMMLKRTELPEVKARLEERLKGN